MRSGKLRWMAALLVAAGVAYLVAFAVGGRLQLGLEAFGVTAVCALSLLVFGRRSETIRGLSGDDRDERFALLDLRATAYAGIVLILAVIGGFVYEVAQGRSGAPYFWLGALAGVTYLVSILILRIRS